MNSTPAKNVSFIGLVFADQRKNMVADNYSILQTLYPQFHKEPKLPNGKWFLPAVLLAIAIMLLFFSKVRAEEPNWDKLIKIIAIIESNNNPNAVSSKGAIGILQISPLVLKEFNQYVDTPQASLETGILANVVQISIGNSYKAGIRIKDRIHWLPYKESLLYNSDVNELVGLWYLKRIWFHYLPHYKLEQSIQNLLVAYNFGVGNLVKYRQGKIKLPKETRNYLKKYFLAQKKGLSNG